MGLFDRFTGRRDGEDALANARRAEGGAAAPLETDSGEPIGVPVNSIGLSAAEQPAGLTGQVPGLENLGALGQMIQQAVASGDVKAVRAESQQIEQQALAMRSSMLEVFAKHGVDASAGAGQSFPMTNMALQQDIMAVLEKHGVSPVGGAIPGWGTPAAGAEPSSGMSVEPGTPGEPGAS